MVVVWCGGVQFTSSVSLALIWFISLSQVVQHARGLQTNYRDFLYHSVNLRPSVTLTMPALESAMCLFLHLRLPRPIMAYGSRQGGR